MGSPKQLLPLGPKPVIRHCLDNVIAAGVLTDIVVVLGPDSDGIRSAIGGLPVRTIVNSDRQSDMAGSVRQGLKAVDPGATGVLVCLADHPLVAPETIAVVVSEHGVHPESIIIPSFQGRRGHPTLFPRAVIDAIVRSATLRDVIMAQGEKVRLVAVLDEGIVLDMDTPDDYERTKGRFS